MHLYIHVPFCRSRCAYCDFITYAGLEHLIDDYVDSVCVELDMLRSSYALAPSPIRHPTLFFGGGTPSILNINQIERLLQVANTVIPLDQAEITMEANPGTIDKTTFYDLRALGINRLSIGVQSLDNQTLRMLRRIHTAEEAAHAVEQAQHAGFEHISIDLLFGLPNQTSETWATTLNTVVHWQVDHLSLYSLLLEEHTPLYDLVERGFVQLPDEDTTADWYEMAMEYLATAGYVQYEISNWACASRQPSHHKNELAYSLTNACQHNIAYWLNQDYLAAGAGAYGHCFPERYENISPVQEYIAAVQAGQRPIAKTTTLTLSDLCAETMFMGLRMNDGVRFAHFFQRCGLELEQIYGTTLFELETLGLIERDTLGVRLTQRGRMLGNHVFERFV